MNNDINSSVHGELVLPPQESPVSRPATRSPSSAKWELGWQDPDAMLKISVFDESRTKRPKGAPQVLRDKITRMEQAMLQYGHIGRRRFRTNSFGKKSKKFLELFRSLVKSVMLLLRCFRKRRKFAVQSRNMSLTHTERTDDLEIFKTSSINRDLRLILSTPPEYRKLEDLKKIQFYLRATGANRLLASASSAKDLENLARHIAYERYENGRVVAQQGRKPDRFYFVITGKLLIVKEYHIETGIISKTVGVLTKGMTTNVEEMEQRSLRKASLICRGSVETLVLDCNDYFQIHGERGGAPREFLSQHKLFKSFPFKSVKCHKHMIRLQYYPKGAVIFAGGTEFEWIYAIKSGECSLIRVQMVADLRRTDSPLFNKRTAQELGCLRIRRTQSAAESLADFRMWRRPQRPPPASNRGRSCQTALSNNSTRSEEPWLRTSRTISANMKYVSVNKSRTRIDNPEIKAVQIEDDNILSNDVKNIALPRIVSPEKHTAFLEPETEVITLDGNGPVRSKNYPPGPAVLSKSRFSSTLILPSTPNNLTSKSKHTSTKSSPPSSRQAFLELGKLKSGDVLGLEDTVLQMEDLPHIRLISDNGVEVVLLNRKFFLRNAPTSLLSRISCQTSAYPNLEKARSDLEVSEAWVMYKSSLVRVLTSRDNSDGRGRSSNFSRTQLPRFDINSSPNTKRKTLHTPRLIPPGTADKGRNDISSNRKQYSDRVIKTALPSPYNVRQLKRVEMNLVTN